MWSHEAGAGDAGAALHTMQYLRLSAGLDLLQLSRRTLAIFSARAKKDFEPETIVIRSAVRAVEKGGVRWG